MTKNKRIRRSRSEFFSFICCCYFDCLLSVNRESLLGIVKEAVAVRRGARIRVGWSKEYNPCVRHEQWTHTPFSSSSSFLPHPVHSFYSNFHCFSGTLRQQVSIDKISEIVSSGRKVVLGSWMEGWKRVKEGKNKGESERDEEEIAFFGMSTRWRDYKGKDVICSSTHDNGFAASFSSLSLLLDKLNLFLLFHHYF